MKSDKWQSGKSVKVEVKKVILFLILLIIIFLTVIIFAPKYIFSTTKKLVAADLGNWIINSEYQEWKTVQLPNSSTMKIPKSWEIRSNDNSITIYENEQVIANGMVLDEKEDDSTIALSAFTEACFGFPVVSKDSSELTVTNLGNGARYFLVTCTSLGGIAKEHYQLVLSYHYSARIVFDFGDNETIDTDTVLEEIEAMAFSYAQ